MNTETLEIITTADLKLFVQESNRIEGIHRAPTKKELAAHMTLLQHGAPDIGAVSAFVWSVAGKPLREREGMNVRVGNHFPPLGGLEIPTRLGLILHGLHRGDDPYEVHRDYETLHPFMDGNGRSGRALWLWQMINQRGSLAPLRMGFLHLWYYQSLSAKREAP